MQEFSKMQTIDVFQLKSSFEQFERVGGRPVVSDFSVLFSDQ